MLPDGVFCFHPGKHEASFKQIKTYLHFLTSLNTAEMAQVVEILPQICKAWTRLYSQCRGSWRRNEPEILSP